jgi:hypothetical protein
MRIRFVVFAFLLALTSSPASANWGVSFNCNELHNRADRAAKAMLYWHQRLDEAVKKNDVTGVEAFEPKMLDARTSAVAFSTIFKNLCKQR